MIDDDPPADTPIRLVRAIRLGDGTVLAVGATGVLRTARVRRTLLKEDANDTFEVEVAGHIFSAQRDWIDRLRRQ